MNKLKKTQSALIAATLAATAVAPGFCAFAGGGTEGTPPTTADEAVAEDATPAAADETVAEGTAPTAADETVFEDTMPAELEQVREDFLDRQKSFHYNPEALINKTPEVFGPERPCSSVIVESWCDLPEDKQQVWLDLFEEGRTGCSFNAALYFGRKFDDLRNRGILQESFELFIKGATQSMVVNLVKHRDEWYCVDFIWPFLYDERLIPAPELGEMTGFMCPFTEYLSILERVFVVHAKEFTILLDHKDCIDNISDIMPENLEFLKKNLHLNGKYTAYWHGMEDPKTKKRYCPSAHPLNLGDLSYEEQTAATDRALCRTLVQQPFLQYFRRLIELLGETVAGGAEMPGPRFSTIEQVEADYMSKLGSFHYSNEAHKELMNKLPAAPDRATRRQREEEACIKLFAEQHTGNCYDASRYFYHQFENLKKAGVIEQNYGIELEFDDKCMHDAVLVKFHDEWYIIDFVLPFCLKTTPVQGDYRTTGFMYPLEEYLILLCEKRGKVIVDFLTFFDEDEVSDIRDVMPEQMELLKERLPHLDKWERYVSPKTGKCYPPGHPFAYEDLTDEEQSAAMTRALAGERFNSISIILKDGSKILVPVSSDGLLSKAMRFFQVIYDAYQDDPLSDGD